MEHLDRLIPLAILGVVAAFVLFLLRRSAREKDVMPRSVDARIETAAPISVAQPILVDVVEIKSERPKKERAPAVTVQAAPAQTPIHTVLGLLKEKDTLAAAFLLREILAPPVSKRQ
jgi:hypothetical protein